MSKVLWHITMSLDGFVLPRDYSTEWMSQHGNAGADLPAGIWQSQPGCLDHGDHAAFPA